MLDFFKTASGSYNYVLMGTVMVWFSSTGVIIANFYKHRNDTVSAQKATKVAEEQKAKEERLRLEAEARLATAEAKIVELTPPPLKTRIRNALDLADKSILEDLARGVTDSERYIPEMDVNTLRALQREKGAERLILLHPTSETHTGSNPRGAMNILKMQISPDLLKE